MHIDTSSPSAYLSVILYCILWYLILIIQLKRRRFFNCLNAYPSQKYTTTPMWISHFHSSMPASCTIESFGHHDVGYCSIRNGAHFGSYSNQNGISEIMWIWTMVYSPRSNTCICTACGVKWTLVRGWFHPSLLIGIFVCIHVFHSVCGIRGRGLWSIWHTPHTRGMYCTDSSGWNTFWRRKNYNI